MAEADDKPQGEQEERDPQTEGHDRTTVAPDAPDGPEPSPSAAPPPGSEPLESPAPLSTDTTGAEPAPEVEPAASEAEPSPEAEPAPEPAAAATPDAASVAEPAASEAEVAPAAEPAPEPAASEAEAASGVEPAEAEPMASSESEAAPESAAASEAPSDAEAGGKAGPKGGRPGPKGAKGGRKPKSPAPSRIVEGVVTAVSADEVELTLDDGRPAVIGRRNFSPDDTDPTTVLSVGDRAFGAELSREDPKRRVVLSRSWALKRKAWDGVMATAGLNEPLEGTVVSAGGKGLVVDVGVRGFVPVSHLELEPVSDLKSYVGQKLAFKVLEADPLKERLVLSRRSLLLKEQRKAAQELLAGLKTGQRCAGTVTSLTNYGAFVDIGGVNGLVHLSEMSWRRVRKPADVVTVGDHVEVEVLDVKAKKRRISLSMRRLSPDPLDALTEGEVIEGRVTRLVDFGAFVAIDEAGDLEGLVHLSELAEHRVSTPEQVVAPGERVGVKILSVDTKRRRIELSIRRAAEYGG